jgi:hypothetical protein
MPPWFINSKLAAGVSPDFEQAPQDRYWRGANLETVVIPHADTDHYNLPPGTGRSSCGMKIYLESLVP